MIAVTTFAGRTVAVFGLARSGLAAARSLRAGGAQVACWDDGERGRAAASAEGLPLVDLREAVWSTFAALVLAPGVPLTHPEPHWTVKRAQAAGVEVIGDTELFFRELATLPANSRPKVVGITGTNGKSTTTALTAHLLRHAGKRVAMGGNIGEAVLGLAAFSEVDVYVLELSSYQIDLTPGVACDVGILLNLSPDHLERHGDMAGYAAVKETLISKAKTAIVGLDDNWCRDIALRRPSPTITDPSRGPTIGIHSRTDSTRPQSAISKPALDIFGVAGDLIVAEDGIFISGPRLTKLSLKDAPALKGPHNAQNAAAACVSVQELKLKIPLEKLQSGLNGFGGLAHRMELLGRINGPDGAIAFVNDSKATNADSAAKALTSFGNGLFWIAGGLAKEGGIESLVAAPYFNLVFRTYLIGDAQGDFAATLENHNKPYKKCESLVAALKQIMTDMADEYEQNRAMANLPHCVLLSPACASFDQFKDFEDRGDQFRKLVNALPGFVPFGGKAGK